MFLIICTVFLALGCSSSEDRRESSVKGEYIYRLHRESLFTPDPPQKKSPEAYPWEEGMISHLPKITKEYFRCNGSSLNPMRIIPGDGEPQRLQDCGGTDKHSLPLRDNKEFIYPILIELLNAIQTKSQKRVVITCGHRCPDHNSYSDPSARFSKHMIGAEVSFYVQGWEERPEAVVALIQDYYKDSPRYRDKKEYIDFQRYEKGDTDVSTLPWYNKEVFIKIYKKREGRDFDNRHPFPYISIQVRYDRDLTEKVIYTWEKANRNYLRK